ncbi:hypothetical protein [Brevibacillus laterosporus]|uniref:hypothetical protein n=1 Tax=Brevibacillus laterosporus TaxID=1465 RepID=UPI000E6BB867|nr:hypothetical protein [Brevibacillus laterosporus]AYB37667.1 hypothetical protein D5F52_04860 [Brevibacillus laterosporus]MBM7111573.1 hypothetical protein [Brevibacillus laterosporus]
MGNSKYGRGEVIDLSIYDENGRFITKLDSLKNSYIGSKGTKGLVKVQDALVDQFLIAFIGECEKSSLSDFQKDIHNGIKKHTYVINSKSRKKCKLVATTLWCNEDGKDKKVIFEIPNAVTVNNTKFYNDGTIPSPLDVTFAFYPYNDKEDIYKIHIESDSSDSEDRFIGFLAGLAEGSKK